MAEHFVAHLKIEKVTKPETASARSTQSTDRVIDEVTQITLKGKTLETLVDKLGQHISIIEEN